MDHFKPAGEVQHSGTFNAPLPSILGGLAFCRTVTAPSFYPDLLVKAAHFYQGLDTLLARLGLPVQAPRHGARFGLLMGLEIVPRNYEQALAHRRDLMLEFVRQTASREVYFHDYGGGPCHHGFSAAHTIADLDQALQVIEDSLKAMKDQFATTP
jgi:glutamate-1-semialdehyde aminotransferase